MVDLTLKQRSVLNVLLSKWEKGQSLPSCREICNDLGFSSPKAATDHLSALKNKGYIADSLESCRGYQLTERATGIPLYGSIPAGNPVKEEQAIDSHISLSPNTFGIADRSKAFFLRVCGDSMVGRNIFDGDLVLIEQSQEYKSEDIVAALIDNESTLKTLVFLKGSYWLRSENPEYPDLTAVWDLQIQGIARSVFRVIK